MEILQLVGQLKDPAAMALFLWTIVELRRVRGHLRLLHDEREEHAERLTRLEERTGMHRTPRRARPLGSG